MKHKATHISCMHTTQPSAWEFVEPDSTYISCTHTHTTHTTQPSAWEFVEPDSSSNLSPVLLFLRMLYFSTSTATLCGTSLIEPLEWYTGLTVSLQVAMLLGFWVDELLFSCILKTLLLHLHTVTVSVNS